ncbi:MAG: DNA polymerase III subunit beta, partial [Patescibacteria group bacterium]|nr:DNA polymerase III subunit beta [Patescibacteria group bacterium]
MKLTVNKKPFVRALATVKGAVQSKTTLPILSHVLIRTFEKSVELVCTDLDMFARVRIDCDVKEKGCLTASARLLHQIVAALPGDDDTNIKLELVKGALRISCGDAKYNLAVLDAEEFPPMPKLKEAVTFKLFQQTLRTLLHATSYPGADAEDSRYVLCGTLLSTNGKITAVATDGRRLAELTLPTDDKLPKSETIIPRRTVANLVSLLGDEEKAVTVTIGENQIQFAFNAGDADVTLTSKVIEGNYPNWKQVVPDIRDASGVPVGRADLLNTIKRVSLLGGNVKFEFAQQLLTISARSELKDVPGDATECLLIPRCRAGSVNANARYLVQALEAVADDEVLFYNPGKNSPIVLKPKDGE